MKGSADGSVRVLHVINQLCGRGGAEVSLRDLVVATAADEHQRERQDRKTNQFAQRVNRHNHGGA